MLFSCYRSRSNKGSALLVVILVMVVISIFILAFISLFGNNLLQTKYQEKNMESYYLSLSGVDLGVAALLKQGVNGTNDTLLYKSFNKSIAISATPTLNHTLTVDKGQIIITITAFDNN